MRRWVIVTMILSLGWPSLLASPAVARHRNPRCTVTIHHPLGTDEIVTSLPLALPDEIPTDLGLVKIFVNCGHHH